MTKAAKSIAVAAAAALLGGTLVQGTVSASPPPARDPEKAKPTKQRQHDFPDPMEQQRRADKKLALEKVLRGQAEIKRRGDSKVVKLGKNRYAQLQAPKTDKLFNLLCEFGDKTDPRTGGEPGPVHNEIAEPDRDVDNSTYWVDDFTKQHYQDMFFASNGESMANFYLKQSSGEYTVTGDVSGWVTVPYNEARYGSNEIPESDGYWNFVRDCTTAWYEAQKASGKTDEQIKQYLAPYDQWDRFDYDGDGNFDERDGYIDHIQLIHAGEGEEAGGGVQGENAIWSHRWAAFPNGSAGPEFNKAGGTQVGSTGIFVRDYTTEPENGGLGVFAHEYGHDLGLPDEYDTSGEGENGTGYWTLMSSGSWLGHGEDSIGTTPGYMSAWDKLQMGWLDYEVAMHDKRSTHTLGLAERQTQDPQAVVVVLPQERVITEYNKPYSGEYEWWSGSGDELNNFLTRPLDLTGASEATLSTKSWHEIEKGYDFGYLEVSADGGQTWDKVGDPVTGSSGGKWTDLSWDLSDYAGSEVQIRFRYATDGGVHPDGWFLDNIVAKADGETIFSDDVESGPGDWEPNGFTRMTGTTDEMKGRYYIAENRRYVDYDSTLKTGPYHFGYQHSKPNWVDHYPYQDGMVVWFWDETQEDNNTSQHPGKGLILPVDAHPKPITYNDGTVARNRHQTYDSTFGVERTDPVRYVREVKKGNRWQVTVADVSAKNPVRVFDDSKPNAYWRGKNETGSVKVAGVGVKIRVKGQSAGGDTMDIVVRPAD